MGLFADVQGSFPLFGEVVGKKVEGSRRYKYLGPPFGTKRQDTGRMREVSIAKGVWTVGLFYSVGCDDGGFSTAIYRRVLTSFV